MEKAGFLGINKEGWQKIGIEAAAVVVAPIDIYRGTRDLFDARADRSEALQKITFGVVGCIPVFGTAARVVRGAYLLSRGAKALKTANLTLRTASQMRRSEKINKVLGKTQWVLNHVAAGGAVYAGYQFTAGLTRWKNSNSNERADIMIQGLFTAAFAIPHAHARRARKGADRMVLANEKIDHPAARMEHLGPLPPRHTAPRFRWAPVVERGPNTVTITYPTAGKPLTRGVPLKSKLRGLSELYVRNTGGGLQAFYSGNTARKYLIRSQFSDAIIAGVCQVRGIRIHGTQHLPKGDAVMIGLNHYSILDFAVTNRAMYTIPTHRGIGYDEAITMKKAVGRLPGLGKWVGLASPKAGKVLIPIEQGAGSKAQRAVIDFFHGPRAKPSMLEGRPRLADRSVWFYGPGHRTTR
ncbi:MAG: hypothetical protein U1D33_04365, partial [bacterium]|nr:hypothetical protein [bacterium]